MADGKWFDQRRSAIRYPPSWTVVPTRGRDSVPRLASKPPEPPGTLHASPADRGRLPAWRLTMFGLALSLLTVTAPLPQRHDDPPIRIKLNEETYARGDRAKVKVRAADTGYLLVLRGDADGRVRVLFPIA